jgi:WD40 repeat protein
MTTSKVKLVIAALLMLGLGTAASAVTHQIWADEPAEADGAQNPPQQAGGAPATTGGGDTRNDLHGDPLPPGAISRLGTLRFRPGGFVNSVDITPDGKYLVTHGHWSGISVWDTASGKELRRHTSDAGDWIGSGLLTPDGQTVVALERVGQKNVVRLRDRANLTVIREFAVGFLQSPRLTPDGKLLVALGGDGNEIAVSVWDLAQGKQLRTWKAHGAHVWAIDLSRDGKTLATGGQDNLIRVWDMSTGRLIRELTGNPNVVGKLSVSPDGKRVASLGMTEIKSGGGASVFPWDNRIRIWNVDTGEQLRLLQMDAKGDFFNGHPPGFSMLDYAPDGKTLVTAGADGLLRFWDPASGREQRRTDIGRGGVMSLAFAPDGQTLAVAGSAIRLIDPATGKDKLPQFGHVWSVFATAASPDGETVATGAEGHVQLWDARTGRPRKRLDGHEQSVHAVQISNDGRTLVSASRDKTLRIWDLATGTERRRLDTSAAYNVVAVTEDSATVAIVNDDKSIRLVDVATGKERQHLAGGDGEWVGGAAFTPDGRSLIVWRGDHTVQVWDLAAGKLARQFDFAEVNNGKALLEPGGARGRSGIAYVAAVSPDRGLIAYASQRGYLAVHEVSTGKAVRVVTDLRPDGGAGTLAFSPDCRSLAWSGWHSIHLLELATGKERQCFDGHRGRIASLAYSADGRTLVSGSEDTTALVWDVVGRTSGQPGPLDPDSAWRDLASEDAATAFQVMRRLSRSARNAVALVNARLAPIPIPDARRLAKLIADLDSGEFELREAAERELETHGEPAAAACRAEIAKSTSLEVRRRLETIADKQERQRWNPGPERLRALRAVEMLELAGTVEAQAALKRLADGAPGAHLTEEARVSLVRLRKRTQSHP